MFLRQKKANSHLPFEIQVVQAEIHVQEGVPKEKKAKGTLVSFPNKKRTKSTLPTYLTQSHPIQRSVP